MIRSKWQKSKNALLTIGQIVDKITNGQEEMKILPLGLILDKIKMPDNLINADNHARYNTRNYPHLVAQHAPNWQIFASETGHLASIAIIEGCESTTFGGISYLRSAIRGSSHKWEVSDYGRKLLGETFMAYREKEGLIQ